MNNKDKSRYNQSKVYIKNRLMLSNGSEVRFILSPNRNNQIRHLDIQYLKPKYNKLELISQIRIHYRHLDLFFTIIDALRVRLDKEAITSLEPEIKRHRFK